MWSIILDSSANPLLNRNRTVITSWLSFKLFLFVLIGKCRTRRVYFVIKAPSRMRMRQVQWISLNNLLVTERPPNQHFEFEIYYCISFKNSINTAMVNTHLRNEEVISRCGCDRKSKDDYHDYQSSSVSILYKMLAVEWCTTGVGFFNSTAW